VLILAQDFFYWKINIQSYWETEYEVCLVFGLYYSLF